MSEGNATSLDRDGRIALLTILTASGIGNRRTLELVKRFGSTEAVLAAPAGEVAAALKIPLEVGRSLSRAGGDRSPAEKLIGRLDRIGARMVTFWDDDYPVRLREIHDPPVVLYSRGESSPLYHYAVAVVGTRVPSDHSVKMAQRIAAELATAGVAVVSGMALGIDSLAHEGALRAGGRTVAVLGSGIDVIYPPSSRRLFERIIEQGAVLTEYPPGTKPEQHHFPQRNRIISGLSVGVVIVEAGLKSGALITARTALDQGRELFSVPGPAAMPRSLGVNRLIKDGAAYMIESGAEVIEHLRSQLAPVLNVSATLAVPKLEGGEAAVYGLLEHGPELIDEVIRRSGIGAVEVNRLLTTMQLKGIIRRYPGARIGRV